MMKVSGRNNARGNNVPTKERQYLSFNHTLFDPFFDQPHIGRITSKEANSHAYLHHEPEYGFSWICMPRCTKYD